MNKTSENQKQYDDEIDLVGFAAMLVSRQRVFYLVFGILAFAGVGYALIKSESYQYTSLVEVAKKGPGEYLEDPLTTIASIENRWLPDQEEQFRQTNGSSLPVTIEMENPKDTGLLQFTSISTNQNIEVVKQLHESLVNNVIENQNKLVSREQAKINEKLASIDTILESLQSTEDAGPSIAEALENKLQLESDIKNLEKPEKLVVSRKSINPVRPNRLLIIVVSFMVATIIGIFAIIIVDFVEKVRQRLFESYH